MENSAKVSELPPTYDAESPSKKVSEFSGNIKIKRSDLMGSCQFFGKDFDEPNEVCKLLDYKICKITFWYGNAYSPRPPVLNGIKFTYKHLLTNKILETEDKYGKDQLQGSKSFELEDSEYIVGVDMRNGWVIDCLTFKLNSGRKISVGGQGGGVNFKFDCIDSVIIGCFGNYGKCLYRIGYYYISDKDYKINVILKYRRMLLVLIKHRLLIQRNEVPQKIDELIEKNKKGVYSSEIAFGKLCLLPTNIFASVILFSY